MTKKKMVLMGICTIVVAGMIFGGMYLIRVARYRSIVANIEITTPDLSEIEDGVYYGALDALLVAAEVRVIVLDHQIVEIDLDHRGTERGEPALVIVDHVLDQQTLDVDAISGATNSSKIILGAIENALTNGDSD